MTYKTTDTDSYVWITYTILDFKRDLQMTLWVDKLQLYSKPLPFYARLEDLHILEDVGMNLLRYQ